MAVVITTAVAGYTGVVGGLEFRDGKATADPSRHRAAIAYCRRTAGYTVTPEPAGPAGSTATEPAELADVTPEPADTKPRRGRSTK